MNSHNFNWRRETEAGFDFFVLSASGPLDYEAWVTPSFGANLCKFIVDSRAVIDYDPALLRPGEFTGTPVLYPTPNRVRGGLLHIGDAIYSQAKRGRPVLEHGLVYDEPWQYNEPIVNAGSVTFEAWIDFDDTSDLYASFPFEHRITLRFILDADGLTVAYEIDNRGTADLPFGFGLHPYFMKLSGENETFVTLPARHAMETTPDLLPTGVLIDVAGTPLDLNAPVSIGSLDLDHVYTGIPDGAHALVEYRNIGLTVTLDATPDFSHLVIYSPSGKDFFCIENQTCSTDAHNMYAKGHDSGLKFVKAGAKHAGAVQYRVRRTKC